MRKNSYKKEKFQERIQNEVNSILRYKLNDSRLTFVSITKVDLSGDFSQATIYWDTFNSETRGDCKIAIEAVTAKIRSLLSQTLNVRHTPQLIFLYDAQFEEESKIDVILKDEKVEGKFNPGKDFSETE